MSDTTIAANTKRGFRTTGHEDSPGGGYKRNFNKNPSGRFGVKMHRSKHSRSKSRM